MLYDPERHEPVQRLPWDAQRARDTITQIARLTESHFAQRGLWPIHPLDGESPQPEYMLYCGASGVIWALYRLQRLGAVELSRDWQPEVLPLLPLNRAAMGEAGRPPFGSYLMGDTSILMLDFAFTGRREIADEIARLVHANVNHPAREFMWGAPGTLAAALFMHQRTGEARWVELFRATAATLWSQRERSEDEDCDFFRQGFTDQRTSYIGAVHGHIGVAAPLILGRELIADTWLAWQASIAKTVRQMARWEEGLVNFGTELSRSSREKLLLQYCHGAPGFVICLGDFPGDTLDDVLAASAALTWQAGPLRKGSNLCHGTAGNGYTFLKLFRRTADIVWLERARAFAMHAIVQFEHAYKEYGQARFSLWTGDLGLAFYLWDCIVGSAAFPTVDCFFEAPYGERTMR